MARQATSLTKKDLKELEDKIKMAIYKDLLAMHKKEGKVNLTSIEKKLAKLTEKYAK